MVECLFDREIVKQCSFLVAMGDFSLRKISVEEKRAKVEKDSKVLLDHTRKAIARLTYLKRLVFWRNFFLTTFLCVLTI